MQLPIVEPAPLVTAHAEAFRDLFENRCQFRHFENYLTGLMVLPNKSMANIARCVVELSITHNLDMMIGNQSPSCSQILQSFPSAPDHNNARFSVGLASQETAELGNPTNGLMSRWNRFG